MKSSLYSALLHLRPAFSFLLMPVFFLALSSIQHFDSYTITVTFILLHLLVYPASNGYNSLMDKDEGSIGGLENPPEAPPLLFPLTLVLDISALLLTALVHPASSLLLITYIIASRLYSWRRIRIKKYPIFGFFWVIVFQGAIIYWFCLSMFQQDLNIFSQIPLKHVAGMFLSSLMIASSYPLTQVYQHEQDKKDGIHSISMLLGIRGTFRFCQFVLILFSLCLFFYLLNFGRWYDIIIFLIFSLPASIHFIFWYKKIKKDVRAANYSNTMKMSIAGALGTNFFFIYLIIMNQLQL